MRKGNARAVLAGVALLLIAAGFTFLRPKPMPGLPLRDFESYYAAGATWRYHGDAYGRDVWRSEKDIPGVIASRDELLPFVGPPFGLPLWELFARLPWLQATLLWGTVMAVSGVALAVASARLGGRAFDAADCLAMLAVCAAFGPLTSGLALGQVAIVSCAAIALVPYALAPRRTPLATACALAAALQPNLALVLAARLAGRQAWLAFPAAALFAGLASMLAVGGLPGFVHYLAVLRDHAAAERFIAIQITTGAVTRSLGAGPGLAGQIALGTAAAVLALVLAQVVSRRYAPDARLALASAALPLALPFAHEHDLTIVLVPAVLAVRRARGFAWLVAAFAFLCVSVDWLGLAQRPTGSALSATLALAAALTLPVLAAESLRRRHFIPALVAPVVYGAGMLAAAHSLNTWPNALPALFHLGPHASAATVWHAEQVAGGITQLDPAWGLLRLCSLLGCALLWFVASIVLLEPSTAPRALPLQKPAARVPGAALTDA